MADADGVAGNLGDGGIGEAEDVAAVAGGDDARQPGPLDPARGQQPVEHRLSEGLLFDALVGRG